MTGRRVLGCVVAIVLATAVLPPAAAWAVNQRRVARATQEVSAVATRLAAGGDLSARDIDPWGNLYIARASAVVSRGPNGILETEPEASVPGGDDILAVK